MDSAFESASKGENIGHRFWKSFYLALATQKFYLQTIVLIFDNKGKDMVEVQNQLEEHIWHLKDTPIICTGIRTD